MSNDPGSTLSERIEKLRGKVRSVADVRKVIEEAREVAATPESVKLFFGAVAMGDSIALHYLRRKQPWSGSKKEWLEMPWRSLIKEWLSLSWEEWLRQLRSIAEGGDVIAQESIEVYETFSTNPLLLKELQEVLTTFERPCRTIRNKDEIISFLEDLVARGLAEKTSWHPKRKAIHWAKAWYIPKRGVPLARLGWIFAVRATVRAQKNETAERKLLERLKPLLDISTTESSDPEDLGLTRLLNGEFGIVTLWDEHSRWNNDDQGLLAVALEKNHCGCCLIVRGVIADYAFPEEISKDDYELPLLIVEEAGEGLKAEGLKARLGNLHHLGKEEFRFVKQVEKIIQRQLIAENQAAARQESEVEPATV